MFKRILTSVQSSLNNSGTPNTEVDNCPTPKSNLESLLACAVFFLWNLYLFFRKGLFNSIPVINLPSRSSAEEIRKAWGFGDAGSLLEVALTWSNFDSLNGQTQNWILVLWTLGMSALEVPLIWLERLGIPFFYSLLAINLSLWTAIVFLIWKFYSPRIRGVFLLSGILILSLSWDFDYMLRDFIFYTESMSYGLLFIGLTLFSLRFFYSHLRNTKYLLLAGMFVGFSLMFRHTSDSGLWVLLIISSLTYFRIVKRSKLSKVVSRTSKFKKHSLKKSKTIFDVQPRNRKALDLCLFGGIAVLTTMPWRILRSVALGQFHISLSGASVYVPRILWTMPESPNGQSYGWNGGNWACLLDRITCLNSQGDIENAEKSGELFFMAVRTALRNPIDYAQVRIEYLVRNWIPGFNWFDSFDSLVATLFLTLPIILGVIVINLRKNLELFAVASWVCFMLMHAAQLLITHYESRYFIPLRILSLGLFLNVLMCRDFEKKSLEKTVNP